MSTNDHFMALLLAAERDPSVRSLAEFAEAESLKDRNEAFRTAFEKERVFAEAYPELFEEAGLSPDQKTALIASLRAALVAEKVPAGKQVAFPVRWLTAAAGLAAVFLLGVFVGPALFPGGSKNIQVAGSPADDGAFREFAARWVESGINLDRQDDKFDGVQAWLKERNAPSDLPRHPLADLATMGCKVIDWNGHTVSLVCFKIENGEIVHLFFSSIDGVPQGEASVPLIADVEGRSTAVWKNAGASYVLVAHDTQQPLCTDLLHCSSGKEPALQINPSK